MNSKKEKITKTLAALPTQKTTRIEKITESFTESANKIRSQASSNGFNNSSVLVNALAKLESDKNLAINEVELEFDKQQTELQAELSDVESKLANANMYCSVLAEKRINVKREQLKDEQAKTQMEVFKYNNGLDEKEQRYANTILQTNKNLELNYIDINSEGFTVEELTEAGYYDDIVRCITAYYDTLTPTLAYDDIVKEGRLAIYLEHLYQNIIFMYYQRAQV